VLKSGLTRYIKNCSFEENSSILHFCLCRAAKTAPIMYFTSVEIEVNQRQQANVAELYKKQQTVSEGGRLVQLTII
jgi:hypothetical protein